MPSFLSSFTTDAAASPCCHSQMIFSGHRDSSAMAFQHSNRSKSQLLIWHINDFMRKEAPIVKHYQLLHACARMCTHMYLQTRRALLVITTPLLFFGSMHFSTIRVRFYCFYIQNVYCMSLYVFVCVCTCTYTLVVQFPYAGAGGIYRIYRQFTGGVFLIYTTLQIADFLL